MYIQTRIKNGNPPKRSCGIRLAICQPQAGLSGSKEAIQENLKLLKQKAKIAKDEYNAHIISFPELFLSGYAFENNEVAYDVCLSVDEALSFVAPIAKEIGIAIICPYPEKGIVDDKERYYDAMVVIDENGELLKNYRKTHLWGPDEQRLWSFGYNSHSEGEAYSVFKINDFPMGVLNCYEAEFAELSRILVTKGAKLVVIPTAADLRAVVEGEWTTQTYPDISKNLIPARALENEVFVAYNNYTGIGHIMQDGEKSDQVEYLGNSVIADPHGKVMTYARNEDEVMLIADCISEDYAPTHPCGTNYIKDRRPSLYSQLIDEEIEYDNWTYPVPAKPIY
jgi:predicted amidohydrolase